jgi:hypothetical protein
VDSRVVGKPPSSGFPDDRTTSVCACELLRVDAPTRKTAVGADSARVKVGRRDVEERPTRRAIGSALGDSPAGDRVIGGDRARVLLTNPNAQE